MKIRNQSIFHIKGINQERVLNELAKQVDLFDINRKSKSETIFKCSFFDHKKVEKILKSYGIVYDLSHYGFFYLLKKSFSAYGLVIAILLSLFLYSFQYQFVLQYEINGAYLLDKTEVVEFLKLSYSRQKAKIDTHEMEIGLTSRFEEIAFASCMIKGQTIVVNIKEKLMPEQMYGEFQPLIAQKSGKIASIELISGTLNVKIGEFVQAGDVLVEPYTLDTSGQIKKVEAKANIVAHVYNEGSVDHYEKYIERVRTGRICEENDITLFGLSIYHFKEEMNFDLFETETEEVDLVENLFLPFKMKKTIYYELTERVVESSFDDVKAEFVEKAKQKALENCLNCDKIIEEYYTMRHLAGVTIVNYCVVTEEQIGGF